MILHDILLGLWTPLPLPFSIQKKTSLSLYFKFSIFWLWFWDSTRRPSVTETFSPYFMSCLALRLQLWGCAPSCLCACRDSWWLTPDPCGSTDEGGAGTGQRQWEPLLPWWNLSRNHSSYQWRTLKWKVHVWVICSFDTVTFSIPDWIASMLAKRHQYQNDFIVLASFNSR